MVTDNEHDQDKQPGDSSPEEQDDEIEEQNDESGSGKKGYSLVDVCLKEYFSDKERLADFLNNTVFKGKYIIDPDNIVFLERELNILDEHGARQERRDIVIGIRNSKNKKKLDMIIDLEGQGHVDFGMAFRMADYAISDCRKLLVQKQQERFKIKHNRWEREKKKAEEEIRKKMAEDPDQPVEFFSKPEPKPSKYIAKDTKIPPYISVVLHYGAGRWTAGQGTNSQTEELDSVSDVTSNYKYVVIDPATMSDATLKGFLTDVQLVLEAIKVQKSKRGMNKLKNDKRFQKVYYTAGKLIYAITGVAPYDMDGNRIDDVLNIKGGYVNMCEGVKGIAVEAEKKGIEKGMMEGEERAYEAVSHIMNGINDGLSDNDISGKYSVDVRRVQKIRADMRG